jgi:hypothetical protein
LTVIVPVALQVDSVVVEEADSRQDCAYTRFAKLEIKNITQSLKKVEVGFIVFFGY